MLVSNLMSKRINILNWFSEIFFRKRVVFEIIAACMQNWPKWRIKKVFFNHSKRFKSKFMFLKIQFKCFYSILVNFRCLCRYFPKNLILKILLGKKFETNHFNFRRVGRFVSSFINTRKGHFHIFRRIFFKTLCHTNVHFRLLWTLNKFKNRYFKIKTEIFDEKVLLLKRNFKFS